MYSLAEMEREADWLGDHRAVRLVGVPCLRGTVEVQGSKNAAQKLVPICALRPGRYRLTSLPLIRDTFAVLRIIEHLGGSVLFPDRHEVLVDTVDLQPRPVGRHLTALSTGTFQFAGALLARFGRVEIAGPGGDQIGGRPVDLHLRLFRELGARVDEAGGVYRIEAPRLRGARFRMPIRSAGVLVNGVLAAAGADGPTTISNIPMDSDIAATLQFMLRLGVDVEQHGAADGELSVRVAGGGHEPVAVSYATPRDRNDAATWLIAAAAGGGPVDLRGAPLDDMVTLMAFLRRLGVDIEDGPAADAVRVWRAGPLRTRGVEVRTGPSPEFHSDWGQLAMVLLAMGDGQSSLADLMYEGRYTQVPELRKMGADLSLQTVEVPRGTLMFDRQATQVRAVHVDGVRRLRGASVTGRDVRGAAALALAGALAEGRTVLGGADQLARGYEQFRERLAGLGARCELA